MEKNAKIFIAGNENIFTKGFVGYLKSKGYKNILTVSTYNLDLMDSKCVSSFFKRERPDFVFFPPIKSGGILANIKYPADFIYENLQVQNNIINYSYKFGVKKLLFIGSSCIYPCDCPQPMKEEYLFSGRLEKSSESYAIAKIAGIKMCQAYNQQYGTNYISLVPATIYGPDDDFYTENSHVIPSLIRKTHEAKINNKNAVTVWGTGKPRREFLYIEDFVEASLFLMDNYNQSEVINIGYGEDISIKDLALLIKDIVGFEGEILFDQSKPDGTLQKLLDSSKIIQLGWKPKVSLEEGIRRSYEWYIRHLKRCRTRRVK